MTQNKDVTETTTPTEKPFWQVKTLKEMSRDEWESLCDGCARCCLQKLQDEETDDVYYTELVCHYLEQENCRCTIYETRNTKVPNCVWLKPEDVPEFFWLPNTCAYRLISEGKDLPEWHPLVSGTTGTVHLAGISVKDRVIPDTRVPEEDWEEHVINWVE